jgi:hypothetical protein
MSGLLSDLEVEECPEVYLVETHEVSKNSHGYLL